MAPTIAPKINPTLKTSVGSTAGARAGSPARADRSTVAKRQKTAEVSKLGRYEDQKAVVALVTIVEDGLCYSVN